MLAGALLASAALLVCLPAAVLVVRGVSGRRRLPALAATLGLAPLLYIPACRALGVSGLGFWNGLALLALLGVNAVHCYFHFDRSIQLRLLREFEVAGPAGRSWAEARRGYGEGRVMGRRIVELARYGLAARGAGRFRLTSAGRCLSTALRGWRGLFPVD